MSTTPPRTGPTSVEAALAWASRWEDRVREATDKAAADLAVFVDPEDAKQEALAELALRELNGRPCAPCAPPTPKDLRLCARSVIQSLRLREREGKPRVVEPGSPLRDHEDALVQELGISHYRVHKALRAFNALAENDRQAFFELFIRKIEYPDLVASIEDGGRWPCFDSFRISLRRSLDALYSRENEQV